MVESSHVEILSKGVQYWNNWRNDHPYINPVLTKGSFRGMNLAGANFSGTDCAFADFSNSVLSGTDFTGANLNMADLKSSNLENSIFKDAKLLSCNLHKSNFANADLTRASLNESNLTDAIFYNAVLIETDLRNTIRARTIINSNKDLIFSKIDNTVGFKFVSENSRNESLFNRVLLVAAGAAVFTTSILSLFAPRLGFGLPDEVIKLIIPMAAAVAGYYFGRRG